MDKKNRKTVIYIAGYGRSGSTLLERVFNSHETIFGTGELNNFLDLIADGSSYCSCGEKIQECEFWSSVLQSLPGYSSTMAKFRDVRSSFDSITGILGYIFGYCRHKKAVYREFSQALFASIYRDLPNEINHIVDSSKTARNVFFRPVALSRIGQLNVKVIHLVRDGRGCIWSNLKGSNRNMERGINSQIRFAGFRSAVHWFIANMAAHVFQIMDRSDNYCRIRYENFVAHPDQALHKLGRFLNIDFAPQIRMIENQKNIPLSHQISGNRLRSQRKLTLKEDMQWKKSLRLRHRLLFWVFNWPLALYYGYR